MRWLDSISDTMDMGLGELQELVKNMEAWRAVVHGVAKSQTRLSNWKEQPLLGHTSLCNSLFFQQSGEIPVSPVAWSLFLCSQMRHFSALWGGGWGLKARKTRQNTLKKCGPEKQTPLKTLERQLRAEFARCLSFLCRLYDFCHYNRSLSYYLFYILTWLICILATSQAIISIKLLSSYIVS